MKKMKQFDEASLELILFGFDVITGSVMSADLGIQENNDNTITGFEEFAVQNP